MMTITPVATILLLLFHCTISFTFHSHKSIRNKLSSTNFQQPTDNTCFSMTTSSTITTEWSSLNPESLVSAPCLIEQTLCQSNGENQPQLAKDVDYAKAVLDAWKEQEEEAMEQQVLWNAEMCHITYYDGQSLPLYGHLIRNPEQTTNNDNDSNKNQVPGIILFHTGAGPHDLFLLWKATYLVNSIDCVVMIADLLGDDGSGWGWSTDRSQYNKARDHVLQRQDNKIPNRPILQERVMSAIQTLTEQDNVDPTHLAALGWCFGGHPILELSKMNLPNIKAMATFHGVFDNLPTPPPPPPLPASVDDNDNSSSTTTTTTTYNSEVLICHGMEDPFISDEQLNTAIETFKNCGQKVSLLKLQNAKHGFTNPAQDFNDNDAFRFSSEAANESWKRTIALLTSKLQ